MYSRGTSILQNSLTTELLYVYIERVHPFKRLNSSFRARGEHTACPTACRQHSHFDILGRATFESAVCCCYSGCCRCFSYTVRSIGLCIQLERVSIWCIQATGFQQATRLQMRCFHSDKEETCHDLADRYHFRWQQAAPTSRGVSCLAVGCGWLEEHRPKFDQDYPPGRVFSPVLRRWRFGHIRHENVGMSEEERPPDSPRRTVHRRRKILDTGF